MKKFWNIIKESVLFISAIATIYGVFAFSVQGSVFSIDLSSIPPETKEAIIAGLFGYLWVIILWLVMRKIFISMRNSYNLTLKSSPETINYVTDRFSSALDQALWVVGVLISFFAFPIVQGYWILVLIFGSAVNRRLIAIIQPVWYEDMTMMHFVMQSENNPPVTLDKEQETKKIEEKSKDNQV